MYNHLLGSGRLTRREAGFQEVMVHPADDFQTNPFGTHRFALADIRAVAEAFLIHLGDHSQRSLIALRLALGKQSEMRNFCARK